MRLGVIADVHANAVALDAVLDDMPAVDGVVCLGDVVGYGPHPAACVETVREVADAVVRGNHDRSVSNPGAYRHNEMAHAGLRHAREELDDDQVAWLDGLPEDRTHEGVRLVHSHPAERDRYVYPEGFASLAPHLGDERALLLGHTHVQHAERVAGTPVVNPGSVGQPRDGDPRAAYAVLTGTDEGTHVDLRRVAYDVEAVGAAVAEAGLPARTGKRLRSGE
ncbi:metallophosphoesterase family protein [Halomarina ordinaria]|uniref:Metallophosphoesterase family protein n=1 Tax=Halomarina ordinaria TaxID=3033939 RepID=A0ABD5U8E6_9EURY|nr:metallophosphoesterase family protein [Halomarina sp. PSRA2]